MAAEHIRLVPPPGPNQKLVELLEEALDLARQGRIVGVGLVMVMAELKCSWRYRGIRRPYLVVGLLEALKHAVLFDDDGHRSEVYHYDDGAMGVAPDTGD